MTGTGQVSIVSNMSAIAIASCSLPSVSRVIAARIQARSAPAQNDGPSPARTTARSRVGASRASVAKAVRRSPMSVASKALWTSGRASVTRATTSPGPERSIRREPLDGPLTAASYGSAVASRQVAGAHRDALADPRQPGPREVARRVCGRERPGRDRRCNRARRRAVPGPRSSPAGCRGRAPPGAPSPSSARRGRPRRRSSSPRPAGRPARRSAGSGSSLAAVVRRPSTATAAATAGSGA